LHITREKAQLSRNKENKNFLFGTTDKQAGGTKMTDIYLTSSLKNYEKNELITRKLEKKKFKVYLPQRDTDQTKDSLSVFMQNVAGIIESDCLVIIGENYGKGSSFEIGLAYGLGKPIFCLGHLESDDKMNSSAVKIYCSNYQELEKELLIWKKTLK